MNPTPQAPAPTFGVVDFDGEHGLLSVESGAGGMCRLTLLARTERGYPRRELAAIPAATWREVASAVQRELLRGMDEAEVGGGHPTLRTGVCALSPLILREMAVLFWSLMEDGEGTHIDALLAGWRQLAREERWWLYARASSPSQRQGHGWRRALYFALTDPADTRTAPRLLEIMEAASAQKKSSMPPRQEVNYLDDLRLRRTMERQAKKTAQKAALPASSHRPSQKAARQVPPKPRSRRKPLPTP